LAQEKLKTPRYHTVKTRSLSNPGLNWSRALTDGQTELR